MKKYNWTKKWGLLFLPIATIVLFASGAFASALVPQTPLPGNQIPKYVQPLTVFGPGGTARVDGTGPVTISMEEYAQQILPSTDTNGNPSGFGPTYVWAYRVGNAPLYFPGVTLEVKRGTPTTVTYINNLPSFSEGGKVQGFLTVDQSIHWADPLGVMCPLFPGNPGCTDPYQSYVPAVTHLHGNEGQSDFDGTPDQWFTPNGINGVAYRSYDPASPTKATSSPPSPGRAVYHYPNGQEATTLWFHDHALGITRLHIYAGLEAFYLIRDARDTGHADNAIGLPAEENEIEIMIQDRQFDTNAQYYFPDGSNSGLNGTPPNPSSHPFWIPEFLGDVNVVNGKAWPYLDVEPRRYRFRFVNAANSRFYQMSVPGGPPFWQIGSDGGLLDTPALKPDLLLGPAERADVIVDFSGYEGKMLTVVNTAATPFPDGVPADPATNGQIMQFRVVKALSGSDLTCDPSVGSSALNRIFSSHPGPGTRPGHHGRACNLRNKQIVDLSKDKVDVRRQLTLNEEEGPGGPIMLMLNNSRWNGQKKGFGLPVSGAELLYPNPVSNTMHDTYATELPRIGSTEVWELINISADAHPIHVHLVQFQLLNRQTINTDAYLAVYNAAFPSGVFEPETGPPNNYLTPNADGTIGGNPAVSPFVTGPVLKASGNEKGWKDTIVAPPGFVTRIAIRFAPQDVPLRKSKPGDNFFLNRVSFPASSFDATLGPGYVWHCHILDHEDNEMMRPYPVRP